MKSSMILSYTTVQDVKSCFKYRFGENSRKVTDYLLDTMGVHFMECPPLLPTNKKYYLPKKQLFQGKYVYTVASFSTDFNIGFIDGANIIFTCLKSLDTRFLNEDIIYVQSKKALFTDDNDIVHFLANGQYDYLVSEDKTKIAVLMRNKND